MVRSSFQSDGDKVDQASSSICVLSPYPDSDWHGYNVSPCNGGGGDTHVFPPWALIADPLNKMKLQDYILTIIVPRWPNRSYLSGSVASLIDKLVRLPLITIPLSSMFCNTRCKISPTAHFQTIIKSSVAEDIGAVEV